MLHLLPSEFNRGWAINNFLQAYVAIASFYRWLVTVGCHQVNEVECCDRRLGRDHIATSAGHERSRLQTSLRV